MVGIFETRAKIYDAIEAGQVDRALIDLLLAEGEPTGEEAAFWDFKASLPASLGPKPPKFALDEHNAKMAEIVKDAVAFYNSYGGYLVVGIKDKSHEILGYSNAFDSADLNQRIQGATNVSIETIYRVIDISDRKLGARLGLLYIPRRRLGVTPAQFKKNAPESGFGKAAYSKDDYYFRERDRCIPAKTPDNFEFLYGSRQFDYVSVADDFIENNLPARDQDFTRLIGRDDQLAQLWSWLADSFSPIKILSGLGGVGKTSIVYTFAERLIFRRGVALDRVVWLGAKSETFSGELDRFVPVARTDFVTIEQLLYNILFETGCPKSAIPEDATEENLLELCREHLAVHRYLLIVDNVDSLTDEEQQLVYHLLTQLCSSARTKCIITARRNLGAPRAFYIEVEGFNLDDFTRFVQDKMALLKLKGELKPKEIAHFREVSGGSPLFALSILRLMALGDALHEALRHWKSSDGEAVRDAAFSREIGRLKLNEARILLALCHLPSASTAQLAAILDISRYEVQQAIETLRAFSMTEIDTSLAGGATYSIPSALGLVRPLVEARVPDHVRIGKLCDEYTDIAKNKKPFIGDAVTRAVALLHIGDRKGATSVVTTALAALPDNPDLLCLLGRCYQESGDSARARETLARAHQLGCRKRELFVHWLSVLDAQEDWKGVVDLADSGEKATKLCLFRLKRNAARLQLGDEQARSSNYRGAIELYETALDDILSGLRTYQDGSDRSELHRLSSTIALRWLGTVKMSAGLAGDDERRIFGAYSKAILTYRLRQDNVLLAALSTLSAWLARVEGRRGLSDTAREHLGLALERLKRLEQTIDGKPGFSAGMVERFDTLAAPLRTRIEALL